MDPSSLVADSKAAHAELSTALVEQATANAAVDHANVDVSSADGALLADLTANGPIVDVAGPTLYAVDTVNGGIAIMPIRLVGTPAPPPSA